NISYTESHFVQVYVGEAFGSCGFFGGTCDLGPIFQTQLETLTFTNSISGSTGLTTYDAAPVPGPIVGAGLPGLLGMLGFGGLQWGRRKKIAKRKLAQRNPPTERRPACNFWLDFKRFNFGRVASLPLGPAG